MGELFIRAAEERDIVPMAEMDKACFSAPWSEASFRDEIMKNVLAHYIVAEVDGNFVGYAGMWLIIDEGHITNVAVAPESRGKHIGEALVTVLLDLCEKVGATSQTLEVRASNVPAINLYTKMGFSEGGLRKGYYDDNNEDAIIMWRGVRNEE